MIDFETDDLVLPPALLTRLKEIGVVRSFPKNVIVILEGEPAESLYIVIEGSLRVFIADEDGREVELNTHGPGEYFGELMLASGIRTASVKTLEASKLCLVSREELERFIAQNPALTMHVLHTLIHRVKTLTETVQGLALMDVYGRIAKLFAESAEVRADGSRYVPGISQQKIAEKVGASRGMVNRILRDLSDGEYIQVSRERIDLLKPLPKKW